MLESNLDRTLGMTDEEMTLRFRKAVDLEKQLKIARGVPEKALLPDLLKSSILISMPMISSAAHIAPT